MNNDDTPSAAAPETPSDPSAESPTEPTKPTPMTAEQIINTIDTNKRLLEEFCGQRINAILRECNCEIRISLTHFGDTLKPQYDVKYIGTLP